MEFVLFPYTTRTCLHVCVELGLFLEHEFPHISCRCGRPEQTTGVTLYMHDEATGDRQGHNSFSPIGYISEVCLRTAEVLVVALGALYVIRAGFARLNTREKRRRQEGLVCVAGDSIERTGTNGGVTRAAPLSFT